jgi:8-oxo-dGTP pyrophosphatase MutT (NUDIX family)
MVMSVPSRVLSHEQGKNSILRDAAQKRGSSSDNGEAVARDEDSWEYKVMPEFVAPRAASTILLLRDSAKDRAEIEVFMMVRHYEIDFNSGALVFPGGSVDKDDKEIIAEPALYAGGEGLDASALNFRIAAIRETFEESGILLARPRGSKTLVDAKRAGEIATAYRAALCESKTTFAKILADNAMSLALDELIPYAHWITPEGMPKRFDTWFFLAAAPPQQAGAHDGKESTDSIWVSPREALEGGESGRFKLPFPTTRNLIRLGKQQGVKAALDDARGKPIVTVMPVMTRLKGGRQLRIPLEAGYDGEVFEVGAV